MLNRYKNYNETLDYIEQLESEDKVVVIRPSRELEVGRLEKDPKKLRRLLHQGYEDTKRSYERIMEFVNQSINQSVMFPRLLDYGRLIFNLS